jgi:transcription-repair coupling factor (superfamily II helicase)
MEGKKTRRVNAGLNGEFDVLVATTIIESSLDA